MISINLFCCYKKKSAYPHEYMDEWEKFNEALLPEKRISWHIKYGRYYRCRLHAG